MSIQLVDDNSSQVASSGDNIVKDVVYSNDYHIETGLSVSKSNYIIDSVADETQEFSRVVYGVSSVKENGIIYFQSLTTHSGTNVKTIPVTLSTTSESSNIITTNDDDQITATFGIDGLSFDNNTSSIFFGSNSTFRIKYEPTSPSRLLFQSYNTTSGEYDTKYSIL